MWDRCRLCDDLATVEGNKVYFRIKYIDSDAELIKRGNVNRSETTILLFFFIGRC